MLMGANKKGTPTPVFVEDDGRIKVTTEPNPLGDSQKVNPSPQIKISGEPSNVVGITAASVNYLLPTPGAEYILQAIGNSCYIREGANPTATLGGPGMCVHEGTTIGPFKLSGPNVAVIGAAAVGYLYFIEVVDI